MPGNKVISTSSALSLLLTSVAVSPLHAAAVDPVAGVEPWRRPAGAPVIEWVTHDRRWYAQALTGVQQPYPRSLWFLDSQGNWYTPFNRPGMTPPYDLRGWHQQ